MVFPMGVVPVGGIIEGSEIPPLGPGDGTGSVPVAPPAFALGPASGIVGIGGGMSADGSNSR